MDGVTARKVSVLDYVTSFLHAARPAAYSGVGWRAQVRPRVSQSTDDCHITAGRLPPYYWSYYYCV